MHYVKLFMNNSSVYHRFELCKPVTGTDVDNLFGYTDTNGFYHNTSYISIWGAYNQPSTAKCRIWHNWNYDLAHLKGFSLEKIAITARNTCQFTIGAIIQDMTTKDRYILKITKSHNRMARIK